MGKTLTPRRAIVAHGLLLAALIAPWIPFTASAQANPSTVSAADTMTASALPVVDPEVAFQRAATWLTADDGGPVPYSMERCFPGFTSAPCTVPKYRTDCSGFVSMAFGLSRSYVRVCHPNGVTGCPFGVTAFSC